MRLIFSVILCLSLCACAHFKSVHNPPSQRNTCMNLQRQMLFANTASGNKTQWDVQSEKMQLQYAYRQENCDEIMKEESQPTTKKSNHSKKKHK